MSDTNVVVMIGNVTQDPKLFDGGTFQKATLNIASNDKYKDKVDTCFIEVSVWNKNAQNLMVYVHKGDKIAVEGKLQLVTWEDKTTKQKRSKHVINASSVQFLTLKNAPQRPAVDQPPEAPPAGIPEFASNIGEFVPDSGDPFGGRK